MIMAVIVGGVVGMMVGIVLGIFGFAAMLSRVLSPAEKDDFLKRIRNDMGKEL